jgi:hypothetical protein
MRSRQRELEQLITGIDEEIRDAKRDIKEAETVCDGEVITAAQQHIAALWRGPFSRRFSSGRFGWLSPSGRTTEFIPISEATA